MYEKEWKEAESFPDSTPPNRAIKIDEKVIGSGTYYLYKDDQGNCYYQSERQLKYCQEYESRAKALEKERINKLRLERSLKRQLKLQKLQSEISAE